ncbi:3803_t:CDS:1 [Ambispora gerdemannii]|uniref:3803_t:CDS:1 n=1 Tax=Ambispora gerdemannii TaxID=144530 RepID=A0A9N8WMF7_9GLOM|nr:3803_t:CDS:1 [Ambispora gerdemannii]
MDNNDDLCGFKHSWKIEHFEHLLTQVVGLKFYSEVFFSPGVKISDPSFPWRLLVTPKLEWSLNTINVYLEAIQSPAEVKNNTQIRRMQFQIKVFRVDSEREGDKERKNLTLLGSTLKRSQNFMFDQHTTGAGKTDICRHDMIWPTKDYTARADLVIQAIIAHLEEEDHSSDDDMAFFTSGRFADITFTFSTGEKIPAHRLVLAKGSEYFKNKLKNEWASPKNTIEITDIDYETFYALLHYIYSNKIKPELSKEVLETLHSEARMRSMTSLSAAVVEILFTDVSFDNWHDYYRRAWTCNDSFFQRLVLNYAIDNWDETVTDETMKKILDWGGSKPVDKLFMAKNLGVYAMEQFYV